MDPPHSALVLMSSRPHSSTSALENAMSPPADGTNDAAAALLRSPETGALFRALPCGEMQSSDTTSHADKHTLELQEGLAGFDKIIEPTTTENPLSVGPREPSSTDLARGLNPEGTYPA